MSFTEEVLTMDIILDNIIWYLYAHELLKLAVVNKTIFNIVEPVLKNKLDLLTSEILNNTKDRLFLAKEMSTTRFKNFPELVEVDLMLNIEKIPHHFLSCCFKLHVVMLDLPYLKIIERGFLLFCNKLKCLTLRVPMLETIGDDFLYECKNLEMLSVSSLGNLKVIEDNFLNHCPNFYKVQNGLNLSCLNKVCEIGNNFLSNNIMFEIDLSGFAEVCTIGYGFLRDSKSLMYVNLNHMKLLKDVGGSFLENNREVIRLDMKDLRLTNVGNNMCKNMRSLIDINLQFLTNIDEIGYGFLELCMNLRIVDLTMLTNVKSIGDYFL